MVLTTTLYLLHKAGACPDRYKVLVEALGKGYGKDAPIPLLRILETNGLDDTLWAFRAVPTEQFPARDKLSRLCACDFAEHVLYLFERKYPEDKRPRQTIEVSRRYANGEATQEELSAAWAAADAAAAARAAAAAAAAEAAEAADAAAAARFAAAAAAEAAAGVAVEAAVGAVARAKEHQWQTEHLRKLLTDGEDT